MIEEEEIRALIKNRVRAIVRRIFWNLFRTKIEL